MSWCSSYQVVQSLSHVWLVAATWITAWQDSLSFTISQISSNSCPWSRWCHPTISSSVALSLLLPSVFPSISAFSSESGCFASGAKVLKFQLQHQSSNEYSGLVSFKIGWFDLLAVQGILKSLLQHHNSEALVLSFLSCPALTSVYNYSKNHSFNYTDLCRQSNVSAF